MKNVNSDQDFKLTDSKKKTRNRQDKDSSPVKMMMNLVKSPVLTEKSSKNLIAKKQYTFDVDIRLTKLQIKKLFEDFFEVNLSAINTYRLPPKKTRLSRTMGLKPKSKRVIFTLKQGESISLNQLLSLKSNLPETNLKDS